jgi:hypothetical protein
MQRSDTDRSGASERVSVTPDDSMRDATCYRKQVFTAFRTPAPLWVDEAANGFL